MGATREEVGLLELCPWATFVVLFSFCPSKTPHFISEGGSVSLGLISFWFYLAYLSAGCVPPSTSP